MKRIDLLRHILRNKCVLLREGGKHTIFTNTVTKQITTIPRHKEINSFLAKKICRDLGIDELK
ncbi:MAG: type II toxin-antitoxin system HicA family toxin [bacterium]|nr:type II toxin-antitoxin system HicA family toxin [bacterium]